jgi:cellulose synthase/poly-beta-1,6-N-acetylglucosamine synthase-like glycosyltransferase
MRMLTAHFTKNRHSRHPLGAVAGHVKVGNRRNLITWWQSLEYLSGICVTRMAEQTMGAVSIVPGACSAWSRPALEEIGGFNDTTLAEDADATLALQRLGYQVINENRAVAFTEAPETLRTLARQRKRWTYGNIQVLWKNRYMLLRPKYGLLGMLTMPYAVLSLLLPLVFLPFTVLVAGLSLMEGDWKPIVVFAGLVAVVHLILAVAGVLIAREKLAHLAVVPFYRLIYEPLRAYLLYACAYRVVKGAEFSWDKLERRNTVVAFEKAGAP